VIIPINSAQLGGAPGGIPLWTQPVGVGTWQQQPTTATQTPAQRPSECVKPLPGTCTLSDCSRLSGQAFTGPTNSLGFINADMKVDDPACLRIVVDAASLPPGTPLPICLDLKFPLPAGGTQTRNICVGDGESVLYNVPSGVDVVVSQSAGLGCPPPSGTSVTVNTGAPWGGTGTPPDASVCNGELKLPPLP
jgi:hypothetical protein